MVGCLTQIQSPKLPSIKGRIEIGCRSIRREIKFGTPIMDTDLTQTRARTHTFAHLLKIVLLVTCSITFFGTTFFLPNAGHACAHGSRGH